MEDLISALGDLKLQMKNTQEHLRGVTWPSQAISLLANDVIVWLGMTIRAIDALRGLLAGLGEAKAEAKVAIEEEEGGEDLGEQVREPEAGEVRPETPPQEPEAGAPEGD